MNDLMIVVLGVAFVLMLIGFWCGWYVRGGQVKKLKDSHRKLVEHALRAGWVVSHEELMKNMDKHGIYIPYIPATFSGYEPGDDDKVQDSD